MLDDCPFQIISYLSPPVLDDHPRLKSARREVNEVNHSVFIKPLKMILFAKGL